MSQLEKSPCNNKDLAQSKINIKKKKKRNKGFPSGLGVKNLGIMQKLQETQVQSLVWEDPLEEGMGNPLQYSCLENPMDRGAWQATVHGVTKSQT